MIENAKNIIDKIPNKHEYEKDWSIQFKEIDERMEALVKYYFLNLRMLSHYHEKILMHLGIKNGNLSEL
jgi:hypothetical protein